MPLFHEDNFYTTHHEQVTPIPPTTPEDPIDLTLDTASIFMDLQYGGVPIVGLTGCPDSVTYYSTILHADDLVINNHDVVDPTLKQYKRINNFEIRVTSTPTMTVDDRTNTSTVIGSANIYPVIAPKIGDMLVKALVSAEQQYGVFQVIDVKRNSPYTGSSWAISFSQVRYSTTIRDQSSDPFVIEEYDFEVSNLEFRRNPLIPTVTNKAAQDKVRTRKNLISLYHRTFYNKELGTFVRPNETNAIVYDPMVIKFWLKTVDYDDYKPFNEPIEYPCSNPLINSEFITVFDAYCLQSADLLASVGMYMDLFPTDSFSGPFLKLTALASGLDYIVNPSLAHILAEKPMFKEGEIEPDANTAEATPYIFSTEFYKNGVTSDLLEILILKVINRQAILTKDVFAALELLKTQPKREQFYKLPFILSMLQISR